MTKSTVLTHDDLISLAPRAETIARILHREQIAAKGDDYASRRGNS